MKKTFGFVIFIVFLSLFGCRTKDQDITKDQDGNISQTIKIEDQVWMVENLNVEHYRNGDIIAEVQDKDKWANLKTGSWCYYKNDPANGKKYGKLYNWYAVNDPRGLAPEGWHIPTTAEFKVLNTNVSDNSNSLKSVGQGIGDGAGTNTSGFSALLAGSRDCDGGFFDYLGYYANFWSFTEDGATGANFLYLYYNDSSINLSYNSKESGYSVRCVKD